jgi:hypothetical protein
MLAGSTSSTAGTTADLSQQQLQAGPSPTLGQQAREQVSGAINTVADTGRGVISGIAQQASDIYENPLNAVLIPAHLVGGAIKYAWENPIEAAATTIPPLLGSLAGPQGTWAGYAASARLVPTAIRSFAAKELEEAAGIEQNPQPAAANLVGSFAEEAVGTAIARGTGSIATRAVGLSKKISGADPTIGTMFKADFNDSLLAAEKGSMDKSLSLLGIPQNSPRYAAELVPEGAIPNLKGAADAASEAASQGVASSAIYSNEAKRLATARTAFEKSGPVLKGDIATANRTIAESLNGIYTKTEDAIQKINSQYNKLLDNVGTTQIPFNKADRARFMAQVAEDAKVLPSIAGETKAIEEVINQLDALSARNKAPNGVAKLATFLRLSDAVEAELGAAFKDTAVSQGPMGEFMKRLKNSVETYITSPLGAPDTVVPPQYKKAVETYLEAKDGYIKANQKKTLLVETLGPIVGKTSKAEITKLAKTEAGKNLSDDVTTKFYDPILASEKTWNDFNDFAVMGGDTELIQTVKAGLRRHIKDQLFPENLNRITAETADKILAKYNSDVLQDAVGTSTYAVLKAASQVGRKADIMNLVPAGAATSAASPADALARGRLGLTSRGMFTSTVSEPAEAVLNAVFRTRGLKLDQKVFDQLTSPQAEQTINKLLTKQQLTSEQMYLQYRNLVTLVGARPLTLEGFIQDTAIIGNAVERAGFGQSGDVNQNNFQAR